MHIRDWGLAEYQTVFEEMRRFTEQRDANTPDQLWLVEHPPVFTQGHNGQAHHLLQQSDIPVVQTDRGGQITYHGPGQLIAYTLVDLKRRHIGVREMVTRLENSIIAILAAYDIEAVARDDAPGVYVQGRKIASLGLRVKRGACYHGVSFNVDMDLTPFSHINPCGYPGLEVIDMCSLGVEHDMATIKQQFITEFQQLMRQEQD
jgi:lipoyl(octanoyl) transferase